MKDRNKSELEEFPILRNIRDHINIPADSSSEDHYGRIQKLAKKDRKTWRNLSGIAALFVGFVAAYFLIIPRSGQEDQALSIAEINQFLEDEILWIEADDILDIKQLEMLESPFDQDFENVEDIPDDIFIDELN